jgi:hypothetical protein
MGYISQLGQQVFNKTFLDPISKNEIKRKRKKGKKNERKKKSFPHFVEAVRFPGVCVGVCTPLNRINTVIKILG